MVIGTFSERSSDSHVGLRAVMLSTGTLPDLPVMELSGEVSLDRIDELAPILKRGLKAHGVALVQLDSPLPSAQFCAFCESMGPLLPETDPHVQPFAERGVLLHLRSLEARTDTPELQPFSSGPLALHTEGSARPSFEQPRFLAFHCLEGGLEETAPRTVLTPIDRVLGRLSTRQLALLGGTRYRSSSGGRAIVHSQDGIRTASFRDFGATGLIWSHEGDGDAEEVNEAIAALLASMYELAGAVAVRWHRGMLMVLDNRFYFHGRTEARGDQCKVSRHLLRARILAPPCGADNRPEFEMAGHAALFSNPMVLRAPQPTGSVPKDEGLSGRVAAASPPTTPTVVNEWVCDVFARARDPDDATELRDLWLGRVEATLGSKTLRADLATRWRESRVRRSVTPEEILRSRATVAMVKEIFNTFFRDDLYGRLRSERNVILSSGAVDEVDYGLPAALKETLRYALAHDLYGYSDSRGREATREAIARMESARMCDRSYQRESVVITMGATQAIAAIADFILSGARHTSPSLCAIPNYPPLVQSIARRHDIHLVPTPSVDGVTSLSPLREALRTSTPLVMLQTGTNPGGALVDEAELEAFIEATQPGTMVILDECHEWLCAPRQYSAARHRSNVIRVNSVSKRWSAPGLKLGWFLADPAFVDRYYEFASTSYGGPASLTYTLLEVLAKFETWQASGLGEISAREVGEFSSNYGLRLERLQCAYDGYRSEGQARERALADSREAAASFLRGLGLVTEHPSCSVNVFASWPAEEDSYKLFRVLLEQSSVAVYPGVLSFLLAGGGFRITSSVRRVVLEDGLARLSTGLAGRASISERG